MHLLLKATVPIGLAPGGVYPATAVTSGAVRSYRTLSPLPDKSGGLLSVALSLRLLSPGVTRHRVSVEPGLSSPTFRRKQAQPSGHLAPARNMRLLSPKDQGRRIYPLINLEQLAHFAVRD